MTVVIVNPNVTEALFEFYSKEDLPRLTESGEFPIDSIQLDIGFRSIALTDHTGYFGGSQVYSFNHICDLENVPNLENFQDAICGKCKTSSNRFFYSCLINMIMICKNLLSNITRMYPRYDLNCLNAVGSLMGTLSVAIGINTLYLYQRRCYQEVEDLPSFFVPYFLWGPSSGFLESLNPPLSMDDFAIRRTLDRGPGMIALVIATCLRFGDAMVNYFVPTPTITRSRAEQVEYEYKYGELPQRQQDQQELDGGEQSSLLVVGDQRDISNEDGNETMDRQEPPAVELREEAAKAQETLQSLSFSAVGDMHFT